MPDIATISALLGNVKTATDIAKFIRESDLSIERAELKLKFADLVSALADIKIELVELQEAFAEKEKQIRELEAAFQAKGEMVRRYDAYYQADEEGNPEGVPYCLRCWENDHKQRQLVHDAKEYRIRVCTGCGHRYEGRLASDIAKRAQDESKESPLNNPRKPHECWCFGVIADGRNSQFEFQ